MQSPHDLITQPPPSAIGFTTENQLPIEIGDIERRSGLYILGKPGMGKTSLLIRLAEADIQKGHGVFFLDPHGDAIHDLVNRHSCLKTSPVQNNAVNFDVDIHPSLLVLNPTNNTHSFGINLLACKDIANRDERRKSYNRAHSVFWKIWQNEWGVWLQKIIQHTLYAFIENPGFSLADVPLFLDQNNRDFRAYITSNIKYNDRVAEFWRYEFEAKRDRAQQEEVDAARTKSRPFLLIRMFMTL